MSSIHSTKKIAEAKRASTLEIKARFDHEHEILSRLALVITGDIGAAELSVCKARELVTNGTSPFPLHKQLTEWLKRVTIEAAIISSLHEIALCESRYMYLNCTHSEHLLNGNDSKLRQFRNLLLHIDPEIVIGELENGELYLACTTAHLPTALMIVERARDAILRCREEHRQE